MGKIETLNLILAVLGIILACVSIIIAVLIYCRQNKDRKLKELALQIMAYYAEEQESVKWIAELTQKNERTVQRDLREQALNNPLSNNNRPTLTPNDVRKYL